jgi:YEATS domain-containing protein 4
VVEVDTPPFEVKETGWGEFDVQITIFFQPGAAGAGAEKPVVFYHHLKLHPTPDDDEMNENGMMGTIGNTVTPKKKDSKEVQSWFLDELVFVDPTEATFKYLTAQDAPRLPERSTALYRWSNQAEREESQLYTYATQKIEELCEDYAGQITRLQKELQALKSGVVGGDVEEEEEDEEEEEEEDEDAQQDDAMQD